MSTDAYEFGAIVVVTGGEGRGHTAIVSQPISRDTAGFVLFEGQTHIAGCRAVYDDVKPADEAALGYTQLAYHLIKLASLVIERKILPLVRTQA